MLMWETLWMKELPIHTSNHIKFIPSRNGPSLISYQPFTVDTFDISTSHVTSIIQSGPLHPTILHRVETSAVAPNLRRQQLSLLFPFGLPINNTTSWFRNLTHTLTNNPITPYSHTRWSRP